MHEHVMCKKIKINASWVETQSKPIGTQLTIINHTSKMHETLL